MTHALKVIVAKPFMPNREELAWAAGFFDGEGNVAFRTYRNSQGRPTRGISLQISQCHPEVLLRFHTAVGGLGCVRGPYAKPPPHQDVWMLKMAGFPQVSAVVAMIYPFLASVKRRQASEALREYREYPSRAWIRHPRPQDATC